jgi:hypothetical protein
VKVNSKQLLRVRANLAYIIDKSLEPTAPTQVMIHEADYEGDGWRLLSHNAPGYSPDSPLTWRIPDQHLMLTDDNRYILHDRTGKMLYLAYYKETPISEETAYSATEVQELLAKLEDEVFIMPGYIDISTLTEAEFDFLRAVACKSATPMLDGSDETMLQRFLELDLLSSKGGYVGGGTNMVTYWMKKEYHKYFEFRPLKFRPGPNMFNTNQLIEACNIRFLGTEHAHYELYLIVDNSSRVAITHISRAGYGIAAKTDEPGWQLYGKYGGFGLNWLLPDQDVQLDDQGRCAVKSNEGTPYQLEFKYLAPVTASIMRLVLSGDKSWRELEFPEVK